MNVVRGLLMPPDCFFLHSRYTSDFSSRMTKLRREPRDDNSSSPAGKQLRIVASGTLFLTHTLSLPCHPAPSTVIRAHSVHKTRGGSANMVCLHFGRKNCCVIRGFCYRFCHCWPNSPLWKLYWWHHLAEMRKGGWS